jgi:hypothetical protein
MNDEEVPASDAAEDLGEADAILDGATASPEPPAVSTLLDRYFEERRAQSASTFGEAVDKYNARTAARRIALEVFMAGNGPPPWEGRR